MRRDRTADAAAAAERLAQSETALRSELCNTTTLQERLERRLADADTGLRYAEQRAAEQYHLRAQATESLAEIRADLSREAANCDTLKGQLASANLALQRAEEHHASEAKAAATRFME